MHALGIPATGDRFGPLTTQLSPLAARVQVRLGFHPVRALASLHYVARCFFFGRDLVLISVGGASSSVGTRQLDFRTSIWPFRILASKHG
jgi:hypothetical protein